MKVPIFQVDAFTDSLFRGNPAAVCPLEAWPETTLMQSIAAENNLSETAFFVKTGDSYELRWFTPATEVDLCGHATLASAFIIFNRLNHTENRITFSTRSGELMVERNGDLLSMDFPSRPPQPCEVPEILIEALSTTPVEVLRARDYLVLYENEETIQSLSPDMARLELLDSLGIIVTAPGGKVDFVSRFFAPRVGVPEDPVTGSAHCTLVPFWSGRLKKTELIAHQLSERGGILHCGLKGDRVSIAGKSVLYLEGTIFI